MRKQRRRCELIEAQVRLASQSPVRVVVRWRCVVAVLLPSLPTIRYAKLTGLGASAWQVTVLAADTERLHYLIQAPSAWSILRRAVMVLSSAHEHPPHLPSLCLLFPCREVGRSGMKN